PRNADGSRGTTTAATSAPHSGEGSPTTTQSPTSGSSLIVASTAAGRTFTPPVMITSSARPNTTSRPSESTELLQKTHEQNNPVPPSVTEPEGAMLLYD